MEVSQYIEEFRKRFNLNDEDYKEAAKDLCEIVLSGSQDITKMLNNVVDTMQQMLSKDDVVTKGNNGHIIFSVEQGMNLNNNRYFSLKLRVKYSDTTVEEIYVEELSREDYIAKHINGK